MTGGDAKSLPVIILRDFTTSSCDVMWYDTKMHCTTPSEFEISEHLFILKNHICSLAVSGCLAVILESCHWHFPGSSWCYRFLECLFSEEWHQPGYPQKKRRRSGKSLTARGHAGAVSADKGQYGFPSCGVIRLLVLSLQYSQIHNLWKQPPACRF